MIIRQNVYKQILFRWILILIFLLSVVIVFMVRSRPIIVSYAETRAQSIMISAFDEAVKSAVNNLNYSYDDMAIVSRTDDNMVSSIEIDYSKLNLLRAEISSEVYDKMSKKSQNTLYIPLGTLLGNEYTAGYGPRVKFRIKFLQIPRLDFTSDFYSAGINNVLHQINIKADLSYSIVMHGVDETFTIGMSAVAAQTVVAGAVPDNFTNVIETPDSSVADDIFNFTSK